HEHKHEHAHAAAGHDHGHAHDHDHDHGHDHDHSHGWAPWRFVVLLLPVVLYFLNLPNEGFSSGNEHGASAGAGDRRTGVPGAEGVQAARVAGLVAPASGPLPALAGVVPADPPHTTEATAQIPEVNSLFVAKVLEAYDFGDRGEVSVSFLQL